jgi:hypothetical protein
MDRVMFERFARRAAGLLDRRALFAGLSAAAIASAGLPVDAGAKKGKGKNNKNRKSDACKKRVKFCHDEVDCEPGDPENCQDVVKRCCK